MAQVRSDNILADVNKLLDDKTGVAGNNPAWRPYNNVAEFVTRFSSPSTSNLIGVAEGQFFWVRSTIDTNKADLYSVNKDKSTYKVFGDYYIKSEVDALIQAVDDKIVDIIQIVYSNLDSDHKTYINTSLAGKSFKLFQNGINRFLVGSEYTITPSGGFVLANEMSDGDVIMLMGQVAGSQLSIPSFDTFTSLEAATPRPDGFYRVIADDSEGGDGTESFYLSFQNRLFYDILLDS